jgi:pilus assembly protein Flp/PilA
MNKLFSSKKNEKGQGLVEYAIILSLIAIVVIGVMTTLGKKVCNTMDGVSNSLDGGSGSNCAGGSSASSSNTAYNNYTAIPRMGEPYAVDAFCSTAGSGAAYTNYNVGSGWFQAAGPNVSSSTINGGSNSIASTGTCP